MVEYFMPSVLAVLGFIMGFFYTRTVRMADNLPEKYMTKQDCLQLRSDCRHTRDLGREEVLQRLDRLEAKVDRLSERLLDI
jgi:hypothetical protein